MITRSQEESQLFIKTRSRHYQPVRLKQYSYLFINYHLTAFIESNTLFSLQEQLRLRGRPKRNATTITIRIPTNQALQFSDLHFSPLLNGLSDHLCASCFLTMVEKQVQPFPRMKTPQLSAEKEIQQRNKALHNGAASGRQQLPIRVYEHQLT